MGMSSLFSRGKFTSRNLHLLKQCGSSQERRMVKISKIEQNFLEGSEYRKLENWVPSRNLIFAITILWMYSTLIGSLTKHDTPFLFSAYSPFWFLLHNGKCPRTKLTLLRQEANPVSCKSYPHIFWMKLPMLLVSYSFSFL